MGVSNMSGWGGHFHANPADVLELIDLRKEVEILRKDNEKLNKMIIDLREIEAQVKERYKEENK